MLKKIVTVFVAVALILVATPANAATTTPPTAPRTLATGAKTTSQVALTWTAPSSNGGSAITDYVVQYKANASTTWLTFNDGVKTATGATVTGLTTATAYNFQVAAKNAKGLSPYATVNSSTNDTGIPDAPTTLAGTSKTINSAVLTWITPANLHGGVITDYIVQYKANTSATWLTFNDSVTTTTGATVTGLLASTQYNFRVAAKTSTVIGAYSTNSNVTTQKRITTFVSVGDSITRAFNVTPTLSCIAQDCPSYSWSSGSDATVNSHYNRIKNGVNAGLPSTVYNNAQTGSKIDALDAQLKLAPTTTGSYVTVLSGANDICKATTVNGMTSTSAYTASLTTALTNYTARNPDAKIFVSSVPNINNLWNVAKTAAKAQAIWDNIYIPVCPLVLNSTTANSTTRAAVAARITEYNTALQTVCTVNFANNCKWDGLATYNYAFSISEISTVDYFHPSITGQASLASQTWAKSYWG